MGGVEADADGETDSTFESDGRRARDPGKLGKAA